MRGPSSSLRYSPSTSSSHATESASTFTRACVFSTASFAGSEAAAIIFSAFAGAPNTSSNTLQMIVGSTSAPLSRVSLHSASGMTITAGDCLQVSDVDRMPETNASGIRCRSGLSFRQYRMAGVTALRNHFAIRTDMLSVVAAEATSKVVMSEVVRMGAPIDLHVRKYRRFVDASHFRDRIAQHRAE